MAATANLGLAHLLPNPYDSLPPLARGQARASVSTARSVLSYLDEFQAAAASARQAATLVDFDSKPLIVVTASRGQTEAWPAAQDKLATLSSNHRHDVIADATHASLYLDKTHAAAALRVRVSLRRCGPSRPLE